MSATAVQMSSRFRRITDLHDQALVLKPRLEAYLLEAKFPDVFNVTFRKAGLARKPDGYFHPSTHPRWTARQLYYYLTAPDRMEVEQLDYESRMAVTMGTAVHGFIEMCVRDMGAMIPLTGTCPACKRPHGTKKNQCDEYGTADEKLKSRGHLDGIVSIAMAGTYWVPGLGGFEFKTTNPKAAAARLADNDLEGFKKCWPDYYDQVQEYMRLTGLRQFLVIVAVLGYPWKIIEFQIPFDVEHAMKIEAKYHLVRDHVEMGTPPDACCAPKSKEARACPARAACMIGQMR